MNPAPSLWKLLWLLENQKEQARKIHVTVKVATRSFDPNGLDATGNPTGPAAFTYEYNTSGDLIKSNRLVNKTNPIAPVYETTTYVYGDARFPHFITQIKDPRGLSPLRSEYDDSGRIVATMDAFGNRTVLNHNLAARTETIFDRLGRPTLHVYDARGNVIQTTDAQGRTTSRTYDANDNELTVTDALNHTTTSTYDAQGNRLTVTDPLNNTTTFTYNATGQVLTTTDPRGKTTLNTYDANDNLTRVQDALGNVTEMTYDSRGNLTQTKDALGNLSQNEYDASGNLVLTRSLTSNFELLTSNSFAYDANGNQFARTTTRTTPTGVETLTTTHAYDAANRVTETTDPDGSVSRVVYNEIGKQSKTIDKLGRETLYTYNDRGELTRTTYPDTTFEESAYDQEGRRLTSKDRALRVTSYEYDELGRLKKTIFPDLTFTQTVYDEVGRVKESIDARGAITRSTYDNAGRRTLVETLNSQLSPLTSASYGYDANGNQTSFKDALNRTTTYVYDDLNRRTKTVFPDTTFTETTYDSLGRRIAEIDQAGISKEFAYDSLGRLISVIQHPASGIQNLTTYSYDEVGNQLTQTDANNHTTRFEFDKMGRRTKRTLPGGQFETAVYDMAGNLIAKTDFNGFTTSHTYDSLNRLLTRTADANHPSRNIAHAAAQIRFTYTPTGQRASVETLAANGLPLAANSYTYDLRNRIVRKATSQGTLTYTRDANGNLLTIKSSNLNGTDVSYQWDPLNRLEKTMDARVGQTVNQFDAVGNLAGVTYPNGVKHSYTYNTLNRLTNLTIGNAQSAILKSYAYTLGAAGNRTAVAESGGRTAAYLYDQLYRLTRETIANAPSGVNGVVSYTLDPVGNRASQISTLSPIPSTAHIYDANDRLTTDVYDNNGSTISSGGNTDAYDFEGRLISRNGGQVQILYDGEGNRVQETVNGVITQFLVDDQNPTGYSQVLEEIQNGVVTRAYGYGLDLLSMDQEIGNQFVLSFYLYDGQGSVRALTDQNGVITDTFDYDAWGNLIHRTGTTPNVYQYTGERFDPALGLYHLRERDMNPGTGRFHTQDIFDGNNFDPPSLHRFLYCGANPVDCIDPSGRSFITEFSATSASRLYLAAITVHTTVGVLGEAGVFLTALGIYQSAQLLSTGIDPETGQPATVIAATFAIVDFLPPGKLITRPLKAATKRLYRDAARDIWDGLSRASREGHEVHHRIPLEWAHVFPDLNPNRISNLKLVPTEIHAGANGVSTAWTQFRNSLGNRVPTAQEVLDKAAEIDLQFGQHFKSLE